MNPLDAIRDWHASTKEAIRVARRSLNKRSDFPQLIEPKHKRFFDTDRIVVESELSLGEEWIDNLAVLHLVATFERILRQHIRELVTKAQRNASEVTRQVLTICREETEYWRLSEQLLESFVTVEASIRGQVRQAVKFRDWVAHGHHLDDRAPDNI